MMAAAKNACLAFERVRELIWLLCHQLVALSYKDSYESGRSLLRHMCWVSIPKSYNWRAKDPKMLKCQSQENPSKKPRGRCQSEDVETSIVEQKRWGQKSVCCGRFLEPVKGNCSCWWLKTAGVLAVDLKIFLNVYALWSMPWRLRALERASYGIHWRLKIERSYRVTLAIKLKARHWVLFEDITRTLLGGCSKISKWKRSLIKPKEVAKWRSFASRWRFWVDLYAVIKFGINTDFAWTREIPMRIWGCIDWKLYSSCDSIEVIGKWEK